MARRGRKQKTKERQLVHLRVNDRKMDEWTSVAFLATEAELRGMLRLMIDDDEMAKFQAFVRDARYAVEFHELDSTVDRWL
jgi:hypothetical protein